MSRASQGIHSLLSRGRQMFTMPRTAGLHHIYWWLGKSHHHSKYPLLSSSLSSYCWARCGTTLGSFEVGCPLVSPPSSLSITSLLAGGVRGTSREGLDTVPRVSKTENTPVLPAQTQNTAPFQPWGRDLTLSQPPGRACSNVWPPSCEQLFPNINNDATYLDFHRIFDSPTQHPSLLDWRDMDLLNGLWDG